MTGTSVTLCQQERVGMREDGAVDLCNNVWCETKTIAEGCPNVSISCPGDVRQRPPTSSGCARTAGEQALHPPRPGVVVGVDDEGEFAQQVRAAQGVVAVRVAQIGGPAVVDHHAPVAGDNADGVNRLAAAFGVEAFHGERACAVDMNPVALAVHAQRGLIDMHGRHGQEAFDGALLPLGQGLMELSHVVEERGLGDGLSDQGLDRLRGALEREHLGDEQVHDIGLEAVAVLHRAGHLGGEACPCLGVAAGTVLDLGIEVTHHLLEHDVDEGASFVPEAGGIGEVFATALTALDAQHLVRDGHPDLALRTLGTRVQETARETLGEAAGRIWLALPDAARAETAVLAPTHAMRREIHATIREGLALEGTLHGATLTIERLIGRRLTRADAADIGSYAEGDTVVFHRDAYGCRRDDICTVDRIGDNSVELAHPDGAPRRFRPAGNASRYLGVFDTDIIDIRAGDRIRWTRNRKAPRTRFGHPQAPDLVNGDTAEVLAIDARRVHFMTEHGERTGLARSDPQLRHLDHAYSSTVHAAQGRTARSVIAVLGAAGLTDQTMLYVEMSRACDEFVLLTDDREALAEVLVHRPGLEESALEAIGEALTTPPVVEPEVFDKLRADWAAVRTRAETTGDIAYFTEGYTDVMSRAAALSAIEDLPADMRRFHDASNTLISPLTRDHCSQCSIIDFNCVHRSKGTEAVNATPARCRWSIRASL